MTRATLGALLVAGIAINVAVFAWQWRAPARTQFSTASSVPVVMRTPGGVLEVSTITAEERFDSSTTHTILGVPVGTTIAQIRVPAVYRYHIPLAQEWTLRQTGQALIVVAPAPRPSLPVAIDTTRLESFSSGLWSPLTGTDALAGLQRSITAALARKATSAERIVLQRESARQTVSEFVQKWVLQQPQWQGKRAPAILVFFEDEPLGQRAAPLFGDAM